MSQRLGTPVLRKEDPALLSGRGRYADDLAGAGRNAARPRHPLAASARRHRRASTRPTALAKDGVWAVITGEDVKKISDPFLVALKAPVHQWSLAVDRVRYVGEPVALVVAESRYLAEDAAELVQIEYAPLEAVIDPLAACKPIGAAAACRGQDQRDFGPQIPLRRHQDARSRRPTRVVKLTVRFPPALVHADGMLRRASPAQSGRRQLRRAWRISRARSARIR